LTGAAAEGGIAWLVKPAMDDIFLKQDFQMLKLIPLALLGAYVLKGIGRYGQGYLMASAGERVNAVIRRELYQHIQGMPLGFYRSTHSGELMTRVVADGGRLARLTSGVLPMGLRQVGTIAVLLVVMFLRDWVLALIAAAVFPLVGLTVRALGRQLYRVNRRAQDRTGELSVLLHESFAGAKIVKAFGRERFEQERFDRLNGRLLRLALKDARIDQLSSPLLEIMGAFGVMGAIWYGGYRVVTGGLTPGELFSFTAAVMLLYGPVRQISRTVNAVQQSLGSVERVFEVLDASPAIVDAPGAQALDGFHDRIVFDRVSFRYADADAEAVRDVSLTVHKGETVALVGFSGAGKTTLMDLLPRFHEVAEGRISIDGHDLRQVTVASLRALIGLVTQDTFLFHESLEYNIAYGKPGATREEVERAARLAQAHDFIAALPDDYRTVVGERGVKLSGGQRQRIAIARAFLKNPPILILDEATSELDAESEFLVQQALESLMADRTVLVIAHRLATVRNADRVVVVHHGRIVETGRHEELLARAGGIYRRLAALQMLDVTDD
jgi:subfamily B ATP-binding cassette protein MsbA